MKEMNSSCSFGEILFSTSFTTCSPVSLVIGASATPNRGAVWAVSSGGGPHFPPLQREDDPWQHVP